MSELERDKPAEKQLSDETRMALVVADLEKRLLPVPVKLAFGALATLAGRLIVMSHKDEDKRRNNLHAFRHTIDTVIRMEEERVAAEAIVRRQIDAEVERQQHAAPLTNINTKAIELDVRARARQKAIDNAH